MSDDFVWGRFFHDFNDRSNKDGTVSAHIRVGALVEVGDTSEGCLGRIRNIRLREAKHGGDYWEAIIEPDYDTWHYWDKQ